MPADNSYSQDASHGISNRGIAVKKTFRLHKEVLSGACSFTRTMHKREKSVPRS